MSCQHEPQCPPADSAARATAVVVAEHHEQGWCGLCNGVIKFDDQGELLPNGLAIDPHGHVLHSAAA